MKMCSVFLRKMVVYVHSDSQTTEGVWMATAPYSKFAWNEEDISKKLNEAVTNALEGSRKDVPHPVDWDQEDPLYLLANVRSWREFAVRDCKLVRIEERGDAVRLVPQENRNPKGGFVDSGEPIICSQVEALDWKSLLSAAFDRCK